MADDRRVSTSTIRFRPDRADTALGVDPYVLEDITFTLEEYRRQQAMARHPSAPRSVRTAGEDRKRRLSSNSA